MDLLTLIVLLGTVVALLLQGGSCFFTERSLAIGVVDVILAAAVAAMTIGVTSGQLVIGTDLGILLAQGRWWAWLVRALIVVAAILPAITLNRICTLNGWRLPQLVPLLVGFGVGVFAASHLTLLNRSESELLRVYQYDAWFAPLVLWWTACLTASILALLKSPHLWMYGVFVCSVITPLASYVLRAPTTSDHAGWTWLVLERVSFGAAIQCFAWRVMKTTGEPTSRRVARWMLAAAIPGALFAFLPMPTLARIVVGTVPLLVLIAGIVAFVAEPQHPEPPPRPAADMSRHVAAVRSAISLERIPAAALSVLLAVPALCLIDLLAIGALPRTAAAILMSLSWILLAERLAEGALDTLPQLFRDGALELPIVKWAWERLKALPAAAKRVLVACLGLFRSDSAWVVVMKTVVTLVATLALVAVLAEIITYRPIVISNFEWIGPDDNKEAGSTKAIAPLLVNAIGRLRNDLRTDLQNAARSSSFDGAQSLLAGTDSTVLTSMVAKSDEIAIGSVKVPINAFFAPIQSLVRSALRVRVVSGGLARGAEGRRVIVVNMSDGESWRMPEPLATKVQVSKADDAPEPVSSDCPAGVDDVVDPTDVLIEKLAHRIAIADAAFLAAGLTKDYDALSAFRRGLRWRAAFDATAGQASLQAAIACFRAAVARDHSFSAAHFRLGDALRAERQPRSAIESFRASTAHNAAFIAGFLQQAATLFYFNDYVPGRAAVLPRAEQAYGRTEARAIWHEILALPSTMVAVKDRRAAYFGICRHEFEQARTEGRRDFSLPYFFCSRAAALTPWSAEGLDRGQEDAFQADVLGTLALILESHNTQARLTDSADWACFADQIESGSIDEAGRVQRLSLFGSSRSGLAIAYFRRALAHVPSFGWARCKLASAILHQGDGREIAALSGTVAGRMFAGWEFEEHASRLAKWEGPEDDAQRVKRRNLAAFYYRRAIDEFASAVSLDPSSLDALTTYAYSAWAWTLDAVDDRIPVSPDHAVLRAAEKHAREACRIGEAWRSRPQSRAMMKMSLGEVLLTQGRFEEAIEVLEAIDQSQVPEANELRWDLAQAKLCSAAHADAAAGKILRSAANEGFATIRKMERGREMRPFTMVPQSMDLVGRARACAQTPDARTSDDYRYRLKSAGYVDSPKCGGVEVSGSLTTGLAPGVQVHVWGGDVEDYAQADGATSIRFERPSTDRRRYYFAQLEDAQHRAVSGAVPLRISRPRTDPRCSTMSIKLVFMPVESPP